MANETKIGQLVIDLQIKTGALEKGLETAKKKLQEIEEENKNVQGSNKELEASWLAMSVTAGIAFAKIIEAINEATEEYKAHTQAMSSLQNVAEYTKNDMQDFAEIMDKYSGIIAQTDLATTIKNFSLMGFTVEQTDGMIEALTNSAIRNRNANYTVSEAVRVASEGYRQGLSTLSDSAGVTENLSVMLDKYAQSIGKTASQLTEAEKNQAYLNRTMYAAEPFVGAMEGYLDSLAGKQGQYSQSMRETQIAYTEALEPTLIAIIEGKTKLLEIVGSLIDSNNTAVNTITTFGIAFLGLTTIVVAGKKALDLYRTTLVSTIATTRTFKAVLGVSVFAAVTSAVISLTNAYNENKAATDELNNALERYQQLKQGNLGFKEDDILSVKAEVKEIEDTLEKLNKGIDPFGDGKEGFDKAINFMKKYGETAEEVNEQLEDRQKYLEEANTIQNISNSLDIEATKTKQKEAAQLKNNVDQMQEYLNIIKEGDRSTTEYQNAEKELAKAYSEASTAGGINTKIAQDCINAERLKADEAWKASQDYINAQIAQINMAFESEAVQAAVAQNVGKSWTDIAPSLQSVLSILQIMAGYTPTDVPNITPTTTTVKRSSGSSSYSNKRLDNYKKEIAHKKAMDQITLNEEIAMYQKALNSYARTTDEKRELREKIYELNKELANKEKEILDQQTEDYEAYIQEQKNLRGAAYDVKEQTGDYNKIIQMHKNYLNQIMKDERLSLEERKEIYREELQTIRDYEQQKRDLRVEQIDNTVSQLTEAITKQLEEMQEKDKELIDKNLEEVEKWKDARIEAINEEYDARIEAINKELEALEKAEEQKSRDEEDAEYEKKKNRLEELIAFEHDATTKANYQKELDKLIAEYQKTLDERALEDKKEALNEQKELLEEEQDNKIQAIEDEAEKQKEIYEKQLEELEKYYDEQIDMAQETAEKMLLNVGKNQDKIIELLKTYGDKYEITGQSLGEKLAQGINEGIASKIENIIQKIQDTIDSNLEAKIKEWTSSSYRYEAGANKPQTTSVNITQNNYIEQNPEMPSETYRKLNNVSQNLAAEIAGM